MSAITANTIVITAYPGKHGTLNMSHNAEYSLLDTVDFDSDDSNSSGAGGPKKRRRLTHLSPDEKLLRRKLKNRVAAQTARDRKKALMAELEEKVAKLEEENKLLKRQNFTLKETSSTLAKENAALKSRLSESPLATVKTESDTRSAAPAVPLQKEQVQILSRWMVQYFTLVITLSLMISSACCKNFQKTSNARKRKQPHPSRRVSVEQIAATEPTTEAPHLEWWGSHQRSWNPSTN
ncbi:X-box-binding protein 1 [Biomphalaria pfeifferi]|uniref:X-box-binding protein 1 n=1 Tax=Biomphalaria pfeifferi TaxID=112525 RepID=A0AAD8FEJ7_BIOPF|nr:X-box-binding protein 1 [Biomphalaria pfeifferi]